MVVSIGEGIQSYVPVTQNEKKSQEFLSEEQKTLVGLVAKYVRNSNDTLSVEELTSELL